MKGSIVDLRMVGQLLTATQEGATNYGLGSEPVDAVRKTGTGYAGIYRTQT